MELEKIRQLAAIVQEYNLTRLELDGEELVIERIPAMSPVAHPLPWNPIQPVAAEPSAPPLAAEGKFVTSSMVGVFYAAPAPGEAPFVAVGDSVKAGDTLCIIEAMKLMNEIICETDGTIAEICADNGQVVEYGQHLFRLL